MSRVVLFAWCVRHGHDDGCGACHAGFVACSSCQEAVVPSLSAQRLPHRVDFEQRWQSRFLVCWGSIPTASIHSLVYGPTVRPYRTNATVRTLPYGPTVRPDRTDAAASKTTVRTLPCRKPPYGRYRTENYRTDATVSKTTVRTLPSGRKGYCNTSPFGAPGVLQCRSFRGPKGIAIPLPSGLQGYCETSGFGAPGFSA